MDKMDGGEGGEIKREPAPGGRPWADGMKLRASERHICPFPSVYCGSRSSAKHWTVARIWPPTSDSAVAVCHWWSREGGGGWAINVAGRHVARSSGGSPTSDRRVSLPSLRERPPAPTNDAGGAGAASGKQSHLAPRPTSSRLPIPQMDGMLECCRSYMRDSPPQRGVSPCEGRTKVRERAGGVGAPMLSHDAPASAALLQCGVATLGSGEPRALGG